MMTFRLAGVDSQVVARILEHFSYIYYEEGEGVNHFISKEECYDFVYLVIALQTCQHNPNIKNKMGYDTYFKTAKESCPKSIEDGILSEEYIRHVFDVVTEKEILVPLYRSLIDSKYNDCTENEIKLRSKDIQEDIELSQVTFVKVGELWGQSFKVSD